MTFEELEEACRTNNRQVGCKKCVYNECCKEWAKIVHLSVNTYKEDKVNFFIKLLRKKKLERLLS